jgi:hypothetical protein
VVRNIWRRRLRIHRGTITATDKPASPPKSLSFYLNPSCDFLWLSSKSPAADVTVFDLTGKMLLHQPIRNPGAALDIRHLPKGVYLIRVRDKEGVRTERLLKE